MQNFKISLEASLALSERTALHYLCTLLRGKALRQLDVFCVEVESTTTTYLNRIILGLGTYFLL